MFPSESLFFALQGKNRSGNDFINEAYKKGVRAFVIQNDFIYSETNFTNAIFIKVNNVLNALQTLAINYRNLFNIPVIGVTGSNGKTIVKEWIWQLLSQQFSVCKNPRSFNSQIGVPLSIFKLDDWHEISIFEAGISKANEMAKLENIIQPTVGIFTNLGSAHSEGFNNDKEKFLEKIKLFQNVSTIIFNKDQIYVGDFFNKFLSKKNFFTWGYDTNNDVQILSIVINDNHSNIVIKYQSNNIEFTFPYIEKTSIENILQAITTALYFKISVEKIQKGLHNLPLPKMRLELAQGINNSAIINDSYSADIDSLQYALDFLNQQKQYNQKIVILSDFKETGQLQIDIAKKIVEILLDKSINYFIGIGEDLGKNKSLFESIKNCFFYDTTSDFLKNGVQLLPSNAAILIKGARVFSFENIANVLVLQMHQTKLEINLDNLLHNVSHYQKMLNKDVKLMAMVKAFGYGAGFWEIANVLQYHKVDYLAVAYSDEGVILRKGGIKLPIMVLNTEPSSFLNIIANNLEPEIFSFDLLNDFISFLKNKKINNYPIHLKIDTGMHRLGFVQDEIEILIQVFKNQSEVKIVSIFTHLVASENDAHNKFTEEQNNEFIKISKILESNLNITVLKHILNTTGISKWPNFQHNMVRLGIGMYGIENDEIMQKKLLNVSTLTTTIAQIKKVKCGESVGYGRSEYLQKDTTIATVRLGYADGYHRAFGNGKGQMYLNGVFCKTIGRVCMDATMIDITGIKANVGDIVEVYGENVSIIKLAKQINTIPYELLTSIGQRIKRIYIKE